MHASPYRSNPFAAASRRALAIVFFAFASVAAFAANAGPPPNAALHEKLFLAKFIQIPFRMIFKAYEGDPKKDKPDKFRFEIDTIDLRQPAEFLKLGDLVPNTRYKLLKFEYKESKGARNVDGEEDMSELTVVNVDTGIKTVLRHNFIENLPEVIAVFAYERSKPAQIIRVKKLQEFVLQPEIDAAHHYKLLDVTETEAVIQLPNGETYTVKPHPP